MNGYASRARFCAGAFVATARRTLAVVALLIAHVGTAGADPGPVAQTEIDHLLAFVAASPCMFVRNGETHPGPEARDHLMEKFNFAKDRISTAEEFVLNIATGSSMSGEPYLVRCGKTDAPAGAWLAEELRRFRGSARAPH
jgi:hypothetical protein